MLPSAISLTPRRRALLAAIPAFLVLVPGVGRATGLPEAEGFIDTLGQRTLVVLRQPGADPSRRFQAVAALLDEAVDLDLIARLVLGRHWREASEAQQAEYRQLFRSYARDSLARRFSDYASGERFAITGSRPAGDDDALVSTRIFFSGGQSPVNVDWRVRKIGGRPMIIDVVAEGVSLLVTNRAQFDSIVTKRGIDGLIEEMRGWHAAGPRRAGSA